ncbi:MAG: DMT family transporter [Actinomycetota bacterium]|nr:DMT family transporter [Actinomycetota bacterium]
MATVSRSPQTARRAPQATRLAVIAIVGPITAFSVMNVIVKIVRAPALTFAFYRLWLGALVMLGVLWAAGRRPSWAIIRRSIPSGVLFGLNLVLFFSAIKLTSVADVLILAALQPALTLVVAGPLFGERVTAYHVMWTMVSLGGVGLVIIGSSGTPVWSLAGDLLAFGSLLVWTAYWLLSKRVRESVPAIEYMATVTIVAAVCVTPLWLLSGQTGGMRWQDWLWILLFVAGAQAGHSLLAWSHEQIDVSISSLLTLVEPVIAAVAALVFLGEPLPAISIAGGLVAIVAVGAVVRRATRRAEEEAVAPEIAPA